MKTVFALGLLAIVLLLASWKRETGEPDPPVQQLVPCHPAAGSDDPLACHFPRSTLESMRSDAK